MLKVHDKAFVVDASLHTVQPVTIKEDCGNTWNLHFDGFPYGCATYLKKDVYETKQAAEEARKKWIKDKCTELKERYNDNKERLMYDLYVSATYEREPEEAEVVKQIIKKHFGINVDKLSFM